MSDFQIEDRGGIMVLSDGTGCRPATTAEVDFCAEIERLRRKLAEAREWRRLAIELMQGHPDAYASDILDSLPSVESKP